VSRAWAGRNHCGESRAAAEPVANVVFLAIEPQSTVVSRLRRSFDAQPEATRFVIRGDEHRPVEELVAEAAPYPVAVYGEPLSDTIKEVVDGVVRATVPRQSLVIARGPWVFTREALADALTHVTGRETETIDMTGFCEVAQVRARVLPRP
jgi:2-C-methyl-D-erythritol 4-phosphate cytidylyltransferase